MKIEIWQAAPGFTLYNSEKKQVTLSELKGRNVLLLFFPLAFTSTCTKELCSVRDNIAWYNNVNAIVLAISVDSLHTLAKFKEEQQLNFTCSAILIKKFLLRTVHFMKCSVII